jgi:hypothetical protein
MNIHLFRRSHLCTIVCLSALTGVAMAQPSGGDQSGPGGGRHRHGPAPEAIAACEGKNVGADCSFTGRHDDTLTGTCFARPAHQAGAPSDQTAMNNPSGKSSEQGDLPLACRPARVGPSGGSPSQP